MSTDERGRLSTDAEIEEARRVIATQASTLPAPNERGEIDIGVTGAWQRAENVRTVGIWKVHDKTKQPVFFDPDAIDPLRNW